MRRLAVATAGFALSSSLVAQVSTSRPDSSRRQAAEQHAPKRSRADTLRGSTFECRISGDTLSYRWTNVVPGFDMPIRVTLDWPMWSLIKPTETWQTATVHLGNPSDFRIDENFYVVPKTVDATSRR